jgi:hypothetical protein
MCGADSALPFLPSVPLRERELELTLGEDRVLGRNTLCGGREKYFQKR